MSIDDIAYKLYMDYMNSMQNVLFWDKKSFSSNKNLDFINPYYDQAKFIKHKCRKEKLEQLNKL